MKAQHYLMFVLGLAGLGIYLLATSDHLLLAAICIIGAYLSFIACLVYAP